MLPETPTLLQLARMGWRLATPADTVFVVSSWGTSAMAQRRFENPAARVKALCALKAAMHPMPETVVIYDLDHDTLVAAWANPRWRYTKAAFRGLGLQRLYGV